MSWLLKSLVAKPESEEDDDSHQKKGESGVVDDISQLKDSFTRQWKGFSSFLTGEDELPDDASADGTAARERQGVHDTAKDDIAENDDDNDVDYVDRSIHRHSSGNPPPYSGEEDALLDEGKDNARPLASDKKLSDDLTEIRQEPPRALASQDNEIAEDEIEDPSFVENDSRRKFVVKGMRSDLAELSGTVKNQLSRFSSVIRVVTGDDLAKKPTVDSELEQMSYEDPTVKTEKPLLPFLALGYSPAGGSRGEVDFFEPEPTEEEGIEAGGEKKVLHGDDSMETENENESLLQAARDDINALTGSLVNGISGISKFASNFLPFKNDEGSDGSEDGWEGADRETVPIRDEIIAFANSVALHPETWFEFPLPEEDADGDDFVLSEAQEEHVEEVEYEAPHLAALRLEITPEHMTESRFWKIYFVLLCSKLTREESAELVTPQVMEARNQVIATLKMRAGNQGVGNASKSLEGEAKNEEDIANLKLEGELLSEKLVSERPDLPENVKSDGVTEVKSVQNTVLDAGEAKVEAEVEEVSKETRDAGVVEGREKDKSPDMLVDEEDVSKENVTKENVPEESLNKVEVKDVSQKGEDGEEEGEADEWLEEEEDEADSKVSGQVAQNDEDVSFSDLEDEDDDESDEKQGVKDSKNGGGSSRPSLQEVQTGGESGEGERGVDVDNDVAGLMKVDESGSPVGSDKTESNGWLTVNKEDLKGAEES